MDALPHNVWNVDLNRYMALCGYTILLYDYILEFSAEVDRFWSPLQIRQWGTFIFIVNRYVGVFGHIPIIYSYFFVPPPDLLVGQQDPKCYPIHKYHQFLSVVIQGSVGAILLTRVYALWERSRIILWSLLIYAFGFAGFAGWAITQGKPQPPPLVPPTSLGCISALSKDEGFYFGLVWIGVMIFDSIVFTLTTYRSVALWKQGSRGLVHVVMRDGVVYYAVLGFSTLSNALTFLLGSGLTRGINTLMTNIYPTQTDAAYGSPSCTEPPALTAVMMNDMTTFQTGVEEHRIGSPTIGVVPRA